MTRWRSAAVSYVVGKYAQDESGRNGVPVRDDPPVIHCPPRSRRAVSDRFEPDWDDGRDVSARATDCLKR